MDSRDIVHPQVEATIPGVLPLALYSDLFTPALLPPLLPVTALSPRKLRVGSVLERCPGGRFGHVCLVRCSMGSVLHARAIIQLYY